jgi:hypothetical protein
MAVHLNSRVAGFMAGVLCTIAALVVSLRNDRLHTKRVS